MKATKAELQQQVILADELIRSLYETLKFMTDPYKAPEVVAAHRPTMDTILTRTRDQWFAYVERFLA